MKVKDIAKKHGIEKDALEAYIKTSNFKHSSSFGGLVIDDSEDENAVVAEYKAFLEKQAAEKAERERKEAEERKKREEAAAAERAKRLEQEAEARRLAQKKANRKKDTLANMIITSGCSIDGYKIVRYGGYISADSITEIDRGLANFNSTARDNALNTKKKVADALPILRRKALEDLKEKVFEADGNAIVGVTYDYVTLSPETSGISNTPYFLPYVFNVTANGTAVYIEKE